MVAAVVSLPDRTSGDPAHDPITRRELEARFDGIKEQLAAQKESVAIAMTAADRAVSKAEVAVEKRFENSNEWRTTVETLQRTYMPRTEWTQADKTLNDKVDVLTRRVDNRENVSRGSADSLTRILAAVAALAAVGALLLRVMGH